jgi:hypothetical protein
MESKEKKKNKQMEESVINKKEDRSWKFIRH